MASRSFSSGSGFQRWLYLFTIQNALIAVVWAFLYVVSVVHFSPAQLHDLVVYLAGVLVVAFSLAGWVLFAISRPVAAYLDAAERDPTPGIESDAFACLIALPRSVFQIALSFWLGFGSLLAALMWWTVDGFSGFSSLSICLAATSGGLVSQLISYVWLKDRTAALREELATAIPDASQRAGLIRSTPLSGKLLVAIVGLIAVIGSFGVSLAQVRTGERADQEWYALHDEVLGQWADAARGGASAQAWLDGARAWLPAASFHLMLVRADGSSLDGPLDGQRSAATLTDYEWSTLQAAPEGGSSREITSPNRFSWRTLDGEGSVGVVITGGDSSEAGLGRALRDYAVLILFGLAIAVCVALLASRDIRRTAESLASEMQRVAEGDLTQGRVFDSEDEFGVLARAFAGMADSLRGAVGRIRSLSDSVDAATASISSLSEEVERASAEQSAAIDAASESVEGLHQQVAGITQASQGLRDSMSQSSSAIQQLQRSGEELGQSATTLTERSSDVSGAIEKIGQSIHDVAEQTGGVSDSAASATASVEEMAASVRLIDNNAGEGASLAERMAEAASEGRIRVQQTRDGIREIRRGVGQVEGVIQELVSHSERIGKILEVIDSVADETGLLALNAAIIAAQAGDRGRAFKVVADQVKELSKRVLASTREISDLVVAVQEGATSAVTAINENAQSVEAGEALSSSAESSLDQINEAATLTATRIRDIVTGIREHSRAALHVVELMEKVSVGVDQIDAASQQQKHASGAMQESSSEMETIAEGVKQAALSQSESVAHINDGIELVKSASAEISAALGTQREDCASTVELLGRINHRTRANQASTARMVEAIQQLADEAEALRADLSRFRL